MQACILVETRIAIALGQLESGNTLQMCSKVFRVAKNTTSIMVRNFCTSIKKHLKP